MLKKKTTHTDNKIYISENWKCFRNDFKTFLKKLFFTMDQVHFVNQKNSGRRK